MLVVAPCCLGTHNGYLVLPGILIKLGIIRQKDKLEPEKTSSLPTLQTSHPTSLQKKEHYHYSLPTKGLRSCPKTIAQPLGLCCYHSNKQKHGDHGFLISHIGQPGFWHAQGSLSVEEVAVDGEGRPKDEGNTCACGQAQNCWFLRPNAETNAAIQHTQQK